MMIKAEQVADGIVAFADAEILPKMSGMELWLAAAAIVSARRRLDVLLPVLAENKVVSALGILNADIATNGGVNVDNATYSVDVENAIETAKMTARKYGALTLDIRLIGEITLTENDFESLKGYIMRAGG